MARPPLLLLCFSAFSAFAQTPCEGTRRLFPLRDAVRFARGRRRQRIRIPMSTVSAAGRISLPAFQDLSDAGFLGPQPAEDDRPVHSHRSRPVDLSSHQQRCGSRRQGKACSTPPRPMRRVLSTSQTCITGPPTTRKRTCGWATSPTVSRLGARRNSSSSSTRRRKTSSTIFAARFSAGRRIARGCISARTGPIRRILMNSTAASRKFTSAESPPI